MSVAVEPVPVDDSLVLWQPKCQVTNQLIDNACSCLCCGSVLVTNGSGSGLGSCYFRHWPSRCQQKNIFFSKFFCLLLFEGALTSFFKDKSHLKKHKTVGVKVFSYYSWLKIDWSGSVPLTNGSGNGSKRPKNIRILRIRIRIRETTCCSLRTYIKKKQNIKWIHWGSYSRYMLQNTERISLSFIILLHLLHVHSFKNEITSTRKHHLLT